MNDIDKILERIDILLFTKGEEMNSPVIEEDLGILLYYATRYRYTNDNEFKEKSLVLLNNLVEIFQDKDLKSSFIEGFEGVYWVVHYLYESNIIDDEDILSDLDEVLFESISLDIKENFFDLLHGYIGKIQYLIHSKRYRQYEISNLIDSILNSLYENSKKFKGGLYWYDSEGRSGSDVSINLGIAHGIPSVLVFLARLLELGFKNSLITTMINGLVKTFSNFKNDSNEISTYNDEYIINGSDNSTVKNSRLAWCYGDLGISYSLYYAGLVTNNELWKKEATSILKKACKRGLSDSGIVHFNDYSFFDVSFCHGISGVAYMINKLNFWINDQEIQKRFSYWENELIKNTITFLDVNGDIYYPYDKQDKDYSYIVEKENFLGGIAGTGLVLQTLLHKRFDWSQLLGIY